MKDLIGHCDVLVVVGSKSSSNSNRLREMADKVGIPGYLVDGPEFLHREWFDNAKTVGVTAGASAPGDPGTGRDHPIETMGAGGGGGGIEGPRGARDIRVAQDPARRHKAGRQPFVGWLSGVECPPRSGTTSRVARRNSSVGRATHS